MAPDQKQQSVDVSIVLVAYNRARFIRRTLDTIAGQSYPNFEALICDDASPDETEQVCREYMERDGRFQYFRNPQNLGMPGNLNAGLQRANCGLVAILHDGDIYDLNLIEKWRAALIKYPSAGFVFNRYRHLDPEGGTLGITTAQPELLKGSEFLSWCFGDRHLQCPVWGTVMARKSIYEQMGYFNHRYGFFADVDMWFRIAEKYDVAHIPEALIDLPHRKTLPHLFDPYNLSAHRRVFQIYWNAKKRWYRNQPLTRALVLGKQVAGYGLSLSGRAIRRIKNAGRQSRTSSPVQPTQ